jgi:hypothetical protein
MTVTPGRLLRMTVASLLAAQTDAGNRVFIPGDWPTQLDQFPLVLVQVTRDDKASIGRGAVGFTVVTTIRITARVDALGEPSDQGGAHAEDKLWSLQRQIELAVINSDNFVDPDAGAPFLQQFPSIRSQVGVNADGETQIAELVMEVGMEYFQGPDDFYATVATDIAGFNMHDQRPGLGLTGP